MSLDRLKYLKDTLVGSIEGQMCNLYEVDAEELGAAIDMLKDLEEAMYFCTITESMTKSEGKKHGGEYEFEFNSAKEHQPKEEKMYYSSPIIYAEGNSGGGRSYAEGNNGRSYAEDGGRSYMENGERSYADNNRNYMDSMAGRSPSSRKMYMEAKTMHSSDKAMQLRELEKYMQELTTDIVEMIQDSSPEEKSYLEKKMTTLATKIGQMK